MQVHAVPDSERATTSTGRKLPWGYDYADPEHAQRRIPEEKGPFGKARKRGASRSKPGTPARGQDQANIDNIRFFDDILMKTKEQEAEQMESIRARNPTGPSTSMPLSISAPNLLDAAGLDASFLTNGNTTVLKEPTEVLIWGFGNEAQWAAIDYYEKVSTGTIYEDYDRQPPNTKYDHSLSQNKASSARSLSRQSLRKINEYVGGDHWIKVTFDSPESAERACHYSPHIIQGYVVHAQRYMGRGPNEDKAVRATPGSGLNSLAASPNAASSQTLGFSTSSRTASSATATATSSRPPSSMPPRMVSEPYLFRASGAFPLEDDDTTVIPTQHSQPPIQPGTQGTSSAIQQQQQQRQPNRRSTLRVRGAKTAVLLPPEKAFAPAPSRWQQTFGSVPVLGWLMGKNHGMIGDQVPRKEDGSFDSEKATLYWRMWYAIDACFGTNLCGVRDAEYDG
ncbi:hypothetical protein M011DRAFT_469160 [Sporormia fimetaria CBS 119925]|uniref:Nucleoporin NUP53 n=1 Tax=Sporormia fimetaria CBS 119925 TaxID=1340428 RepID=A0A6A6V5F7_9PLEO|nr:hypothetical protein M011DRAFT_469160 [Sporormia fimetaria CBS 119925]